MKTLQITMEPQLVREVDRAAKAEKLTRSAFVRDALEKELKRRRRAQLEREEDDAYTRMPVQPGEFAVSNAFSCNDDDWDLWEKLWKESLGAKSAGVGSTHPIKRARRSSSPANRSSRNSTKS